MEKKPVAPQTIAAYIKTAPAASRPALRQLLACIRKAAPQASEAISYGIPTFKLNGNLVHFGGWERHVGFYPGAQAMVTYKKDFGDYKTSKGTVQFPLDRPLPLALVAKITKARVAENLKK